MPLATQLEQDLKTALLSGDKLKTEVIRGLKSALQYESDSLRLKEGGLNEEQYQKVLARESKKRQESADVYQQAGELERSKKELAEKSIIDNYLPPQLDETAIKAVVLEELSKLKEPSPKDMGKVIGLVKVRLQAQADGATIARLVKEALEG